MAEERWVSLTRLATLTHSKRTLQYIAQQEPDVLVTREKSGRIEYDLRACIHNLMRRENEKGKRAAAPSSMDEVELRKKLAEAELKELELARERDALMTRADCGRIVADERERVDARLRALSPRLAGAVVGAATMQEALALVQPLIEECREELRTAGPLDATDDDLDDGDPDDLDDDDEPAPERN